MNKKQILEFVAWQRSYIAGIDSFDPAELRDASHVESGVLVNQWKMFVAMCHEWSPLAKDLETITGAVAALDWTVTPATLEGEEPTPLAQEVAKTVQAAIWARGEREQGTWSHDFLDLVRGICHAIYRGHNVHEIIWTRNDRMVFPQEYKPVPPLFYAWTAQGLDRLELCPNGYGMGPGVPFPPDKFIVALNNCGPDHPTQNAVLNALVGWFGASKWGLSWFLQYCQVAGLPIKKFKCQNDSDRKKLQAAVKENPILSEVFVTEPNDLEIIQAAASGASIPQAVVLDMAERACHKLILGNTLTSDTTKDGGSRAQAEVHQEVQNEAVLALGNFVSNILNAQLVPALVRKNYGRTEGLPLPEIRCTVPSAGVNMDRLEFYCKFINELGCPVSRSKLYDDCGVPIPADGDDVVGPVAKPGVEDPLSAAAAARYGADTASRVERRAQAAEDAAEAVAARWMAPVLRSVAELVRSGGSPADVKKKLEGLEPDTDALAAALEEVTRGSLGVGQAVQVGADNPYGCNQYGEGWAEPHNGTSTRYVPNKDGNLHKEVTHVDSSGDGGKNPTEPKEEKKEGKAKEEKKSKSVGKGADGAQKGKTAGKAKAKHDMVVASGWKGIPEKLKKNGYDALAFVEKQCIPDNKIIDVGNELTNDFIQAWNSSGQVYREKLREYTDQAFIDVNEALMQGKTKIPLVKDIDKIIDKCELKKDIKVCRNEEYFGALYESVGIKGNETFEEKVAAIENAISKNGSITIENKTFLSTSILSGGAKGFQKGEIMRHINVKQGTKAAYIASVSHSDKSSVLKSFGLGTIKVDSYKQNGKMPTEAELLLTHGVKTRVVDFFVAGSQIHLIEETL